MKKIILFSLISLFIIESYAQITITDNNGSDLTGQTAFLPETFYFNITNNKDTEITFVVEVTSFTLPADADALTVCACGLCVTILSAPVDIGSPTILGVGETYGNNQAYVSYYSGGSTQVADITIKVYEQKNTSNFAEFTLSTGYVGINNLKKDNIFDVFPNPATNLVTLQTSEKFIGSKVVFTNLLGKTVSSQTIKSQTINLSTSQIPRGVYFYTLVKNGYCIETKKIIIK